MHTPRLFYGCPESLEVQLQDGSAGDFWEIGEAPQITIENDTSRRRARRPLNLHSHRRLQRLRDGLERPRGEWNRLKIRCQGDQVTVWVNGMEANRGIDCALQAGGIALQSEGSTIEFRQVILSPLRHIVR